MIVAGLVRGSFFASQLKTPRFVTSSRRQWRSLDFFQVSSEDSYDQEHPTISSSGTVVARILPKKYIDYERIMKPLNRREDITIWRERVIPNNNKTSSEKILIPEGEVVGNGNQEDMVVVLDVDLITKIWNEYNKTSEPIHVQLHMHRQANETAQRTLQRTEISTRRKIDSFRTGRRKSSSLYSRASNSSTSSDDGSVCLMVCSSSADSVSSYEDDPVELLPAGYTRLRIDNDATSNDLWRELVQRPKSILWLDVLKEESPGINLLLDPCPPTVLSVRTFEDFSADIFNGVPLVIETEVLHAERALIIWFVGEKQVCYDSHCYTPTLDDIGKKVTVFISPIRPGVSTGYEEAYGFEQVVQKRPEMPVVERRLSWLARRSDDDPTSLRVMSYNLLADLYASREIDQRSMYNHCQAKFIKRTRRMPLLVYEILVHQPDIVCLQEVDASIHKHILLPVLKAHGYYGYYSNKASSQLEGKHTAFVLWFYTRYPFVCSNLYCWFL